MRPEGERRVAGAAVQQQGELSVSGVLEGGFLGRDPLS